MSQTLTEYRTSMDEIQFTDRALHCGADTPDRSHGDQLDTVGGAVSTMESESQRLPLEEALAGKRKRKPDASDNKINCKRRKVQTMQGAAARTFPNPDSTKPLENILQENESSTPEKTTPRPLWERIVAEHPTLENTRSTPNCHEKSAPVGVASARKPRLAEVLQSTASVGTCLENSSEFTETKEQTSTCLGDQTSTSSPTKSSSSNVVTSDSAKTMAPNTAEELPPSPRDDSLCVNQPQVCVPQTQDKDTEHSSPHTNPSSPKVSNATTTDSSQTLSGSACPATGDSPSISPGTQSSTDELPSVPSEVVTSPALQESAYTSTAESVESSLSVNVTTLVLPFDEAGEEITAKVDSVQFQEDAQSVQPTLKRRTKGGRGRRPQVYAPSLRPSELDGNSHKTQQVDTIEAVSTGKLEANETNLSDIAESTIESCNDILAKVSAAGPQGKLEGSIAKKPRGRRKERSPLIYAAPSPVDTDGSEQLHSSISMSALPHVNASQCDIINLPVEISEQAESPLPEVPLDRSASEVTFTGIADVSKKHSRSCEDLVKESESPLASTGEKLFTVGVSNKKKRGRLLKHAKSKTKRSKKNVTRQVESQVTEIDADCKSIPMDTGSPVITPEMLTLPFDNEDKQEGPVASISIEDLTLQFDNDPCPVVETETSEKTPKPKKRRGRKSADFEVMDESLVVKESPKVDESPSQAQYLPLAPPGVRRSGRIRRKSLEIYRATKRQRQAQEEFLMEIAEFQGDGKSETGTEASDIRTDDSTILEISNGAESVDCVAMDDENSNKLLDSAVEVPSSPMKSLTEPADSNETSQLPPVESPDTSDEHSIVETEQEDAPRRRGRRKTTPSSQALAAMALAVSPPTKRGKKKNEPSLEEIYMNKLWRTQMPKAKTWETIFELPKPGPTQYQSTKKAKRNINFDEFYQKNRLKKRRQKALKQGWKPFTAKQETKATKLLETKLATLEKELEDLPEDDDDDDPTLEGVDTDSVGSSIYTVADEQPRKQHLSLCSVASSKPDDDVFYTPAKSVADLLGFADNEAVAHSEIPAAFTDDASVTSADSQTFQTPTKDLNEMV